MIVVEGVTPIGGIFSVGTRTVADQVGLPRTTVRDNFGSLVLKRFLGLEAATSGGRGRANQYRLLPMPPDLSELKGLDKRASRTPVYPGPIAAETGEETGGETGEHSAPSYSSSATATTTENSAKAVATATAGARDDPQAAAAHSQLTPALRRIQEALAEPEAPNPSRLDAISLLGKAVGFPTLLASNLTRGYSYAQVRKVLVLVLKHRRRPDNPPGMVRTALEEHWIRT
jgi:hypothetical protein